MAIYLSCEWFVNAVEWLGKRLNVGTMAVGTILPAFGTALPESVVTFVAVTTGGTPDAKDIGVGAAMGGPLALATVAYGVTGVMLLFKRRKDRGAHPIPAGDAPRCWFRRVCPAQTHSALIRRRAARRGALRTTSSG